MTPYHNTNRSGVLHQRLDTPVTDWAAGHAVAENIEPMRPDTRTNRIVASVPRILSIGALLFSALLQAHEVPSDVLVRAFVKADSDRVALLVRVPLESMRDVVLPLKGPGYLDLANAGEPLHDAAVTWIANQVELYVGDQRLTNYQLRRVRVSLPSDRSFASIDSAEALFDGPPLPDSTEIMWNQALLDVWLDYPAASGVDELSFRPNFERLGLRTITTLQFIADSGVERAYEFAGDPGVIRLDPRWHHAFFRFIVLGFEHILDGSDHLLFILCLVIPFRRIKPLIVIVTSFTLAHSVTLISSAFGFVPAVLWFAPLIETLIAASIVYMALENIVAGNLKRRWMIAFAFGLVHGFGFSFVLSDTMQFAGSHLLASLLAFNVGVELGQVLVILLAVPLVNLLFRYVVAERLGIIILSALIAHSGWHWMSDRASALAQYSFDWPARVEPLLVMVLRFAAFAVVVGLLLWLTAALYKRTVGRDAMPGK